jgi:hypothetical protein
MESSSSDSTSDSSKSNFFDFFFFFFFFLCFPDFLESLSLVEDSLIFFFSPEGPGWGERDLEAIKIRLG